MQCYDDMDRLLFRFLTSAQPPMMNFFGTALLLTIWFPFAALSLNSCYFPDGSPADTDVPCNPSWSESACCGAGWDCLANGTVCIPSKDDPGAVADAARGSCTDITWQSVSCPLVCKGMSFCFVWFTYLLHTSTTAKRFTYSTCTSCSVAPNSSNVERGSVSNSGFRYTL